jgi:hypothetical protein
MVVCPHPRVGDVYQLKDDVFVPVFSKPGLDFEYESGLFGNNCYDLETVLLPGFYIQIQELLDDNIVEIIGTFNNSYIIRGYIHKYFIENEMHLRENLDFYSLKETRSVLSIGEIVAKLKVTSDEDWRYSYGCNMPCEVDLNSLYRFKQFNVVEGCDRDYVCRGFDSSGLMHYLSNGNLPHSTLELKNIGRKLFVVSTSEPFRASMIQGILGALRDTDIVIFSVKNGDGFIPKHTGQVIMFYKFGFIEERGKNCGIKKTPPREAEARLFEIYSRAKFAGSSLYVIRWHPELADEKVEPLCFHAVPETQMEEMKVGDTNDIEESIGTAPAVGGEEAHQMAVAPKL